MLTALGEFSSFGDGRSISAPSEVKVFPLRICSRFFFLTARFETLVTAYENTLVSALEFREPLVL